MFEKINRCEILNFKILHCVKDILKIKIQIKRFVIDLNV